MLSTASKGKRCCGCQFSVANSADVNTLATDSPLKDFSAINSAVADSSVTDSSGTDSAASPGDPLGELITAAVAGNQRAWGALYERYAPLVSAVCHRCRFAPSDVDDASQMVGMHLVQHLGPLREPRPLPGWIVIPAKDEALRVLELRRRTEPATR